jgi:phosphoadenosine phosphosulfate reductase
VTTAAALSDEDYLRETSVAAGRYFEGAPATEILQWAHQAFGPALVVASSMGDGVVAHLASQVAPGVDVLFLDTGYHFAETLGTRDAVAATLDVNVRTVLPLLTVNEQDAEYGARLHDSDPDLCCALRKVEPLNRGLAPYLAWASGLRRDEALSRRKTRVVEWDAKRGKVKVNPIAAWTAADVEEYVTTNGVLVNPLLTEGYLSIGCAPCTRKPLAGADARSGRWAGTGKVECGLHV